MKEARLGGCLHFVDDDLQVEPSLTSSDFRGALSPGRVSNLGMDRTEPLDLHRYRRVSPGCVTAEGSSCGFRTSAWAEALQPGQRRTGPSPAKDELCRARKVFVGAHLLAELLFLTCKSGKSGISMRTGPSLACEAIRFRDSS